MPSVSENKAIIREFYERSESGDLTVFEEMFAPNFVSHPVGNVIPPANSPEEFKQAFLMYKQAFPDFRTTAEKIIAEGDMVVVKGRGMGTHQGPFLGLPPTNKKMEWSAVAFYRINEDGLIAERWQELDAVSMMQQLGLIPSFGGPRE